MRILFLVTVALLALSAPVSAGVLQATYTGRAIANIVENDTFFFSAPGHLVNVTAVFTYDSETMTRTLFPAGSSTPLSDGLKAGPANFLPVGVHSASLVFSSGSFSAVLDIAGNQNFTVLIPDPTLILHSASDLIVDGTTETALSVGIGFSDSRLDFPIDVLAAVAMQDIGPRFGPIDGTFGYSTTENGVLTSRTFGVLEFDSIRIAPVPLPASIWLMLSAFGALAALRSLNAACGRRVVLAANTLIG